MPPTDNLRQPSNAPKSSREGSKRKARWSPPQLLPDVPKRNGVTPKWVRKELLGQVDKLNMSRKFREGFETASPSDYPDMLEFHTPAGTIEHSGLILCEMPDDFVKQRREYYDRANRNAVLAADHNLMREARPDWRMPIERPERRSEISGKLREANSSSDE